MNAIQTEGIRRTEMITRRRKGNFATDPETIDRLLCEEDARLLFWTLCQHVALQYEYGKIVVLQVPLGEIRAELGMYFMQLHRAYHRLRDIIENNPDALCQGDTNGYLLWPGKNEMIEFTVIPTEEAHP